MKNRTVIKKIKKWFNEKKIKINKEDLEIIKSEIGKFNAMHEQKKIEDFLDNCVRICSKCKTIMLEGFYDGNYYCDEDCLHTIYTQEEWEENCEEYPDDCYWTQWYD